MRHLVDRWTATLRVAAFAALLVGVTAPVAGQTREMNSSLAGQLRMFQLRVVSGRISARSRASQQNLTSNHTDGQRRERLAIDLAGGWPNVTYERATSDEKLSFEIVKGSRVMIQVVPRSPVDHPTITFVQPTDGSLTLTVEFAGRVTTYHAPTLWHLLVIDAEACHEHLVPLLQIMRPSWPLERHAQQAEDLLCVTDSRRVLLDRAAWQQSLDALANDRYAQRERAEQHLHAAGPVVLPYLRSLERSDLDAEQWFRVRRVMRSLAAEGDEDTPERITRWLTSEPRIWYAMLSNSDLVVRRTAAERLAGLLDVAIEYDADASPDEQERQLATLREQFADALDPTPPPQNVAPR